jgi:FtsZ-binding cell division protein ZapB
MSTSKSAKLFIGSSVLILFSLMLLSAAAGDNFKPWESSNKLTWKDYKDTVITTSKRAALTSAGVHLSYKSEDNEVIVLCYSQMDRDKSWSDTTKRSDYILAHEQYHFNITEYWSRKLKKDLSSAHFSTKNYKEKISDLQKENTLQCKEMQTEYDTETKHSIIKSEQKKWQEKIDELLKKTEDFADKTVSLTLR